MKLAPLARGESEKMNTAVETTGSLSPSQLENAIEAERLAVIYAQGQECRRYQCMRALIAKRTPETVERMERERGLRAP